jgi:glucose-6-phosphate isomerase
MDSQRLWQRHQRYICRVAALGLALDVSRMQFDDSFLDRMTPSMQRAFEAMDALERGAIANPDENRMVGHYWLRAPELAPTPDIANEIRETVADVKSFAAGVHGGTIRPPTTARFTRVLSIGIGGSALGPEFVADALGNPAGDSFG